MNMIERQQSADCTELRAANERLAVAKAAFTAAAQAAINGDPDAEQMSAAALAELNIARAAFDEALHGTGRGCPAGHDPQQPQPEV